jgi:3-methyladenine DNA glycosylase AlkD
MSKIKVKQILSELNRLANPDAISFMNRFGITPEHTIGVSIPNLRKIAKNYYNNHELAAELWQINSRETRILATMIDDPKSLTESQMEAWAEDFTYWEICDQCCANLFKKHPLAWKKAIEWSSHANAGKKRAAFVLMACLAIGDKKAPDNRFEACLPFIKNEAYDNRNLVKKAVNWALRQIGKRNLHLNQKAILSAEEILRQETKSAHWIATDALRELKSPAIQKRLNLIK